MRAARATAVRAVVRAGRPRRRDATPRAPALPRLARRTERGLTPTPGGFRAQLLAAELRVRDEGAPGGAAGWVRQRLRLRACLRLARVALGAYVAPRACRAAPALQAKRARGKVRVSTSPRGVARLAHSNGSRSQKGAQETAGKENSDGAVPHPCRCRRACTDHAASTDAAERPARGRRGRPQPDSAGVDAEPVVSEPAAPAPAQTGLTERAEPQASTDAVAAAAEVRRSLAPQRAQLHASARFAAAVC